MSIVAISETVGSLGADIGRAVATALGYEFADREIITKAAERFGEGLMDLTHAAEEKPTLWERFSEAQRRYMTYIEAIIFEQAAQDHVVLVGRASTVVLRDVSHVLRLRVNAPERLRAERVVQQQGLTPEAAFDAVRHADRELGARVRFFYHVDWENPFLYDLVLNTERLDVEEGARVVTNLLRGERFQTTESSRSTVRDRSLTAQARAVLLANPVTRAQQITVSCAQGVLSLSGYVRSEEQRTVAEEAVAKIPGVTTVVNDIAAMPSTSHPPLGV